MQAQGLNQVMLENYTNRKKHRKITINNVCSPDFLKLGFGCKRRLKVGILWQIDKLQAQLSVFYVTLQGDLQFSQKLLNYFNTLAQSLGRCSILSHHNQCHSHFDENNIDDKMHDLSCLIRRPLNIYKSSQDISGKGCVIIIF